MEYKVGDTLPFPPAIEPEDDPTPVAPCYCRMCIRTAEGIAIARSAKLGRVIAMQQVLKDGPDSWTVMISRTPDGPVDAIGKGSSEEEAIFAALELLGVVA